MRELPILFSAPMVRAILDGRKSQTRRVVKCGYHSMEERDDGRTWPWREDLDRVEDYWYPCPYGKPGDRLWVRETWRGIVDINPPDEPLEFGVARYVPEQKYCRRVEYLATQERDGKPWRPSLHMPRWASRILLEVTDVRVERLQDCSEVDARAEGITGPHDVGYQAFRVPDDSKPRYSSAVAAYESLWDRLNADRGYGWAANPWVWVVSFKRMQS